MIKTGQHKARIARWFHGTHTRPSCAASRAPNQAVVRDNKAESSSMRIDSFRRCRRWIRLQAGLFCAAVIAGFCPGMWFVSLALAVGAAVLNVPIFRTIRCPRCGQSLLRRDSAMGMLPIFEILLGHDPRCLACGPVSTGKRRTK